MGISVSAFMSPQPARWLGNRLGTYKGDRRTSMAVALEINLALWVMIGCLAKEAIQLAPYLF